MAAESWIQQYRAHTLGETSADDALSVGFVRDASLNLNNSCRHALAHKRWSEVAVPIGKYPSPAESTTQTVIDGLVFAPRRIPECYGTLSFILGAQRTAGIGDVTFTVYVHEQLYTGTSTFATSGLSSVYYSQAVVCSSDTNVLLDQTVTLTRDKNNLVWVVITGANSVSLTRGRLTSFDAWPAG